METLRAYLNSLTTEQQSCFAARCGTSIGYLRKAISTNQQLGEQLALSIERESLGGVPLSSIRADLKATLEASGYTKNSAHQQYA